MSEFDSKANDWDKDNVHLERSETIAKHLLELKLIKPGMKAMEFGAGTALLSFILREHFSSITLIDNSREMIRICNEKIADSKVRNIKAIQIDLETQEYKEKFNFIFSQMAFHHISDVNNMIQKFESLLEKNGILAIADLFAEDGTFHGEEFTGHKGFDPDKLSKTMYKCGFNSVSYKTCFIMKHLQADGEQKEYPLFLMIAKK